MKQLYPDEGKRGKGAGTSVTALRNKMTEEKKRKAVQAEDTRVTEAENAARDAMLQLQRPVLETDTLNCNRFLHFLLCLKSDLCSGPASHTWFKKLYWTDTNRTYTPTGNTIGFFKCKA